jgi:dihydrofolate reductase
VQFREATPASGRHTPPPPAHGASRKGLTLRFLFLAGQRQRRARHARTIDAAKKYVVSGTLGRVDWNAELLRGDLGDAVRRLKEEPGEGLSVGGVKLPLALAELGLIDEYEFVVQPTLAGHGPTLFAGLSERIELKLVSRLEFGSGAVVLRYEPRRLPSAP